MVAANGDFYVLTDADPGGKLSKYDALESAPIWETAFSSDDVDGSGSKFTILDNGNLAIVSPTGVKAAGGGDVELNVINDQGEFVSQSIQVANTPNISERYAAIESLSNGNFVVAYSEYNGHEQDGGSAYDLYAKIYDENGSLVSDMGQVNEADLANQDQPDIITLGDNSFIIAFRSDAETPDPLTSAYSKVYGRRYDNDGNAYGGEFQINNSDIARAPSNQEPPSLLFDETNGRLLTVFTTSENGQDIAVNSMSLEASFDGAYEDISNEIEYTSASRQGH